MKKHYRTRIAAAIISIALLATSTPAFAVPATTTNPAPTPASKLAEKQREAQRIENEISILDQQVEIIVEQYNAAHETLLDTQNKLKTTAIDFKDVEVRYQTQKEVFDIRLQALYRNSKFGGLELVLASDSISDLVKRVEFIRKMADRDASILSETRSQREQIEQVRESLSQLKIQQAQLERDLKAKQASIEGQLAQRQQLLASVNADIRAILDTQAAQRNADESALLASIFNGTSGIGYTPKVGSAVWDALKQRGVPYVWGGATPRGFDCSGLVMWVYARHGVSLPHYSRDQSQMGRPVPATQLQPADLVFFGSPVHHVGMYIGGGYFIHAPRTGDVVKISKLSEGYYSANYAGARRFPVRTPY